MTPPKPANISDTQLKTQSKVPATKGAVLRESLRVMENRIAKLDEATPDSALELLSLFDQVDKDMDELQVCGMNLASELGQIDTLTAQFKKKRALLIRKVGGPQVIAEARKIRQPTTDHWWWYVDQSLAAENRKNTINTLRNLGITVVIIVISALLYQRFFAPDPAIQASNGYQQRAENAVLDQDFEYALQEVENAIRYTPENPELYTLQGVILQVLGEPEKAQVSFETALGKYDSKDLFYNARAMVYLMMGDPQSALADAETAIEINPDSALSYLQIAQSYESQGEILKAIGSYKEADEIARRTGNVQLQAIIRVNLSNAYQRIPLPTLDPTGVVESTP